MGVASCIPAHMHGLAKRRHDVADKERRQERFLAKEGRPELVVSGETAGYRQPS